MEARIPVRLTPRASQDRLAGWQGDVLLVQVKAPPTEGEANEALLRLLARALGTAPSRLRLAAGQRSRRKLVAVEGLTVEDVRRRVGG